MLTPVEPGNLTQNPHNLQQSEAPQPIRAVRAHEVNRCSVAKLYGREHLSTSSIFHSIYLSETERERERKEKLFGLGLLLRGRVPRLIGHCFVSNPHEESPLDLWLLKTFRGLFLKAPQNKSTYALVPSGATRHEQPSTVTPRKPYSYVKCGTTQTVVLFHTV